MVDYGLGGFPEMCKRAGQDLFLEMVFGMDVWWPLSERERAGVSRQGLARGGNGTLGTIRPHESKRVCARDRFCGARPPRNTKGSRDAK